LQRDVVVVARLEQQAGSGKCEREIAVCRAAADRDRATGAKPADGIDAVGLVECDDVAPARRIRVAVAVDRFVARSAEDEVVAVARPERVRTGCAGQEIVAATVRSGDMGDILVRGHG
jgi:hypothetical protein